MLLCTTSGSFPRAFRTSSRLTVRAETHVWDVRATGRPGPPPGSSAPLPTQVLPALSSQVLGGVQPQPLHGAQGASRTPQGQGCLSLADRTEVCREGGGKAFQEQEQSAHGPGSAAAEPHAVCRPGSREKSVQPASPAPAPLCPQPRKSKNERMKERASLPEHSALGKDSLPLIHPKVSEAYPHPRGKWRGRYSGSQKASLPRGRKVAALPGPCQHRPPHLLASLSEVGLGSRPHL